MKAPVPDPLLGRGLSPSRTGNAETAARERTPLSDNWVGFALSHEWLIQSMTSKGNLTPRFMVRGQCLSSRAPLKWVTV